MQDTLRNDLLGGFAEVSTARAMLRNLRELNFAILIQNQGMSTVAEALTKATEIAQEMLALYHSKGITVDLFESAHGVGHLVRDFVNLERVLRNAEEGEITPNEAYVGGIAAILHDMGNSITDRYLDENKSDLRHAEVGALMFLEQSKYLEISRDTAMLVAYAIAAHTHYLKPMVVNVDGEEIITQPYVDCYADGSPMGFVWLPRQIDRLDISNVTHTGRYFLTLSERHEDYSAVGFYEVMFAKAMRPLLRSAEEITAAHDSETMLEQKLSFLKTDNNVNAYGKFDTGHYLAIREQNKTLSFETIDAVHQPINDPAIQEQILLAWELHLGQNIDNSQKSKTIANHLCKQFRTLDLETQARMSSVFLATMLEYRKWLTYVADDLGGLTHNPNLEFTSMLGDVSSILAISPEVNKILDTI